LIRLGLKNARLCYSSDVLGRERQTSFFKYVFLGGRKHTFQRSVPCVEVSCLMERIDSLAQLLRRKHPARDIARTVFKCEHDVLIRVHFYSFS